MSHLQYMKTKHQMERQQELARSQAQQALSYQNIPSDAPNTALTQMVTPQGTMKSFMQRIQAPKGGKNQTMQSS